MLAFAFLAALVPSISMTWLAYRQTRSSLAQKATQELQGASIQGARQLDLWLRERVAEVSVFARSEVVLENSGESNSGRRLNDYLDAVRDRSRDFQDLALVDPRGRVLAHSGSRTDTPGLPSGWLRSPRAQPILTQPVWDVTLGYPVTTVAVPVYLSAARPAGALAARTNLRGITPILASAAPPRGEAYLITPEGRFIVGSRSRSAEQMRVRLSPIALRALAVAESASTYLGTDGKEAVGASEPVGVVNWRLVVEVPTAEAYQQARHFRNVSLLAVSGLLLLVGLVAYRLGLFIVRPLDRLIRGATEVAGGDLAVDLPEAGGAEVGALTRVFNHMVAELREQRQKLEQLTITDSLTGLWNRRHLMERLDTEVARAERQNHPLAAIMLDVDHFKAYNDTHGHMAGDEVLARVAGVLRESVRKVDCAARYGGEEFMVLLPDTSAAAAAEVAERIRERVGLPSRLGRRVTVSIGVAEYPLHGDSPAALVASADAALYQAKAAGRNRVVTQNGTGG